MLKHWLLYLTTVILASILFSLLLWLFTPVSERTISYTSPLPGFLMLGKNREVTNLDFWFPSLQQILGSEIVRPNIGAKSALTYDLLENKAIFEKNPTQRLPMASLTKIMTAIVALENKKADDRYVVDGSDLVGEDSMGLSPGEILSLEELLYGLILNSGNDAAETLAGNYPGGRTAFIQAMNDKAQALGLTDTHFSNPTGLEGDGKQYTTSQDLLVISKYALDNFPLFVHIAASTEYHLAASSTHKAYDIYNETNLLTTYPGVKGIKTGYTPEAGYCLITYLNYQGHEVIGILLNSEDRRSEMKSLLDYSLQVEGVTPPQHS